MEERNLIDYWLVLYRRKLQVLLIVLSAIGASVYLSALLDSVYEARVVTFVPKDPEVVNFYSSDASKTIAPRVPIPPSRKDENAPYIGMLRSLSVLRMVNQAYPQIPEERLRRDTDITLTNEFMLAVYVRNHDPKLAADLANTYYTKLNELLKRFYAEALEVQKTITNEVEVAKLRLQTAAMALQSFEEQKGLADLTNESAELVKQRAVFETKIEDAKADLRGIDQRIEGVRQELAQESSLYVPSELVTTNALVQSLKKDLADLEASIGAKATELGERHPDLKNLRAQYQAKRQELTKEIRRIVESRTKETGSFHETLRQNLASLFVEKVVSEARLIALGNSLREIRARLAALPEIRAKHNQLANEVDTATRLLQAATTNLEEVRAQDSRRARGAVLVDPAQVPKNPAFPILWLNAIVAGVLGFIGATFYCFLMDYIQRALLTKRARDLLASPAAASLLRRV
jgi:polysaccharide biosynthesis transport protein